MDDSLDGFYLPIFPVPFEAQTLVGTVIQCLGRLGSFDMFGPTRWDRRQWSPSEALMRVSYFQIRSDSLCE
jgi:hypothetical protein